MVGENFLFFWIFLEVCLLLLFWVYWFSDDEIALIIWWVRPWSCPAAVPRARWSEIVVELPLLGSSWHVRDVTLNFFNKRKWVRYSCFFAVVICHFFFFVRWLRCARMIVGARMFRHLANCSRLIFMGLAVFSLCWPVFFLSKVYFVVASAGAALVCWAASSEFGLGSLASDHSLDWWSLQLLSVLQLPLSGVIYIMPGSTE